ncbi:DinB family protein [Maribacter algarum]|uniref:DinB family protein n=1 Tax=Maribacter algarum (ex Zhang et al. 2020) TaxID=2578118 RepID=A0A5S3PVR3_9FLAO|nr:DinB family protein [Maribacter algarum]TMM59065.1 DinB family protein [Maribacter algarum]
MNRRSLLSLIGLSPLALISSKIPNDKSIVNTLIRRWEKSKGYTMLVLDAMPEDKIEYQPSVEQMSFAQHFMHLGYTNNMFIGILVDSKTYSEYSELKDAEFFLKRPDPINLFQPDSLSEMEANVKKELVKNYLNDTFDFVISSLSKLKDTVLAEGENKQKPWFLEGHTNLDLILRGESHTAHHRAQAISYLRMNGIRPPSYSKNNTL